MIELRRVLERAHMNPGDRGIQMIIDAYNERYKKEMGDDLSDLDESIDEELDRLERENAPKIDPPRDEIGGYRDVPRTVEIPPPPIPMPTLWQRIKGIFNG